MTPTLLVLAAGLGSRYGGLKQIDPVGPSGETLLDYAVFDALRAGFGRVVFVIRRDFEEAFRSAVAGKYAGRVPVGFAFQSVGDLPAGCRCRSGSAAGAGAGRERPWGTGHAVWCARGEMAGPFAVINADDFYGADALARLAGFLQAGAENEAGGGGRGNGGGDVAAGPVSHPPRYALAGFRLGRTLSEHGAVSRGVCRARGGRLESIEEVTGIAAGDVGPGRRFSGEEIVSMNCWAFTPALFGGLEAGLAAFLEARGADPRAEFYLPAAVSDLVAAGAAEVDVLPAAGAWFGVTHREDRPRVASAIAGLVEAGAYPPRLFG